MVCSGVKRLTKPIKPQFQIVALCCASIGILFFIKYPLYVNPYASFKNIFTLKKKKHYITPKQYICFWSVLLWSQSLAIFSSSQFLINLY